MTGRSTTWPGACAAALATALCLGVAKAEPEPGPARAEPVVLIDVRAQPDDPAALRARQALARSLADLGALAVRSAPGSELERALTGQARPPLELERDAALTTLGAAAKAFGDLDCAAAERAARDAVLALAGLRAAGQAVEPELAQAYVYTLLCAHGRGDSDGAIGARTRLEALGVTQAPKGVSDVVWALYPALDATGNRPMVELAITAEPADADIWVDHARVGRGPASVWVNLGEHVVAASSDGRHAATRVAVARDGQSLHLATPQAAPAPPHLELSEQVATWRGQSPDPTQLAALMKALDVRFALVLVPADAAAAADAGDPVEIWSLGPGEPKARLLGVEPARDVRDITETVRRRAHGWDRTGPDPDRELLREPRRRPIQGKDSKPKLAWWAYATIIGAVAVGTAVFLANDLADDRQRIELTWP